MDVSTVLVRTSSRVEFPVVAIGFGGSRESRELCGRIRSLQLEFIETNSVEGARELLMQHAKVTVVVYSPRGASLIDEVMQMHADTGRLPPVVVITDEVDMGQYHHLMALGIADYYAFAEDAEYIARGIEWTARTRSA